MENKFYIYIHINIIKQEIFYVGRGCKNRAYSNYARNTYWHNIVNKYGYQISIIEDNLNNEQANEREIYWINRIGRQNLGLGTLVNMTDGGEGTIGRTPWNKGGTSWSKGLKQTPESIAKRIAKTIGKKRSEEQKIKMSEVMKGNIPWNKGTSILTLEQKHKNKLESQKRYREREKLKKQKL